MFVVYFCFFFFKQKTAYELRISDWSSDVCSSDLIVGQALVLPARLEIGARFGAHVPPGVIDHELAQSFLAHLNDRANQVLLSQRIAQIGRASCRERVCQYV